MARRRFLVAYDIRDDRRLRAVATCMEGYGYRLQYSVFVCDLSGQELVALTVDLESRIETASDSVVIIDLVAPTAARFRFLGAHEPPPAPGAVVL